MADKHPYASTQGHVVQIITQLRKSFPQNVTADTLKKLGIASNNESKVIYVLKFLGLLDQEGIKTEIAARVFSLHDNQSFEKEFGKIVAQSYAQLFELHKDESWKLDQDSLINFFRITDGSTDVVGKKQAQTFQALASLSGHGDKPEVKITSTRGQQTQSQNKQKTSKRTGKKESGNNHESRIAESFEPKNKGVGLTVRIEINLPADGDQETYDHIFKSIRENLLNE